MTINFVPGQVNDSDTSVLHGRWKQHYLIVYGSGNNLIINSYTKGQRESLQTIYLDHNPSSIDINDLNGLIVIGLVDKLIVFKPVNEFMKIPKWTECLQIPLKASINCLQWAPIENELMVGTDLNLQLYKFSFDSSQIEAQLIWKQDQPLPVTHLKITFNANKFVVKNGMFDRLLKVWTRINYGVTNTLFELSYLACPMEDYVVALNWRFKVYSNVTPQPQSQGHPKLDRSLTSIKNFRNFMDSSIAVNNEDFDTLYTFSKNGVFRIWSSYEVSGHNQIKCWGELDLSSVFLPFKSSPCSVLVIENYYLQQLNLDANNPLYGYLQSHRNNMDLLLAIDNLGNIQIYLILNVATIPPNAIKFEKIMSTTFNPHSFLQILNPIPSGMVTNDSGDTQYNPVITHKIKFLSNNLLSVLVHNKLKNTLKFNYLDLNKLLSETVGSSLTNKFQGSEKSIKKLVKSNNGDLVLSISSFPQYNYVWQSLQVMKLDAPHTILTKKFIIDLTKLDSDHVNNHIVDALIIDNYSREKGTTNSKYHLVITYDKLGHLCLWDCNEPQYEDTYGELIWSTSMPLLGTPLVCQLVEITESEYLVILVFDYNQIKCWKSNNYNTLQEISTSSLPLDDIDTSSYTINKFETHINHSKNLVSVTDKAGHLKVYSIKYDSETNTIYWINTFSLYTNIPNCSKIIGSSIINKLAIVDESGSKLCIFDLSSGLLEFEHTFTNDVIKDIDWCLIKTNSDNDDDPLTNNVLLSVGFLRSVVLFTQLRYDYTNDIPTYAVIKLIDVSEYTTHEIGDSVWISNGYLVIGCGNQFFIDDRWFQLGSSSDQTINNITKQLVMGYISDKERDHMKDSNIKEQEIFDLSDIVRILNGPLPVYHPQFLVQLLYMNQYELVKAILVKLFQVIRQDKKVTWDLNLDMIHTILKTKPTKANSKFSVALDLNAQDESDVFNTFNEHLVNILIENLTKISLPLLTRHQQITLTSVITITKMIDEHTRLLDDNGTRFLIGFKLFQLSTKQTSLNMRDISFAIHSNNKDLLIDIIQETYNYKLTWDLIKKLKLIYWVNNFKLLEIVETYIKNEFNQTRDPSGLISLIYVTLNKKQLLLGLWRTVTHKDRDKMLKFLSNDFTEKRWQVAAMKNAFALLGKHRYLDSAYFFLLAGKLPDCSSILNNKLNDFDLSLLVNKLYSFVRNETIDLKPLVNQYLLSSIISSGNKWYTSWMFYELNDMELSTVSLIKPPITIFNNQYCDYLTPPKDVTIKLSSKNFLNEDPALILLYNSIKFKKLSSLVNINDENQFLLKICTIYNKMGCDYLSLILLVNWKFNYPSITDITKPNGTFSTNTDTPGLIEEPTPPNGATIAPPQAAFEEPDMSAFDFGF